MRPAIANQYALASGRKKAEGCRASWLGFSLHDSGGCLFGLTHVQTDVQLGDCPAMASHCSRVHTCTNETVDGQEGPLHPHAEIVLHQVWVHNGKKDSAQLLHNQRFTDASTAGVQGL